MWQEKLKQVVENCGGTVWFNEPLSRHTSFRIGGPAEALVTVTTEAGLKLVQQVCLANQVRMSILGRGTNVLISDQGVAGVVIKLAGEFTQVTVSGTEIYAGAGVLLDDIAAVAEDAGMSGTEFLAGIPGTVGGGLISNAGAYGSCLADVVSEVEVINSLGEKAVLGQGQLINQYRQPVIPPGWWALRVTIKLSVGKGRSVQSIRQERWTRHPQEPSAGSVFKNPAVLPAGKLIEQCRLKGLALGRAVVSERHGNFIVNRGNARFAEVYELIQIVKAAVEEMTGIELNEEVQLFPHQCSGTKRR